MRFRGIQEYLTTVRELTPMLVKPRASKNELPQTLEPESLQSKTCSTPGSAASVNGVVKLPS